MPRGEKRKRGETRYSQGQGRTHIHGGSGGCIAAAGRPGMGNTRAMGIAAAGGSAIFGINTNFQSVPASGKSGDASDSS
jgi:hypothetical protein